MPAASKGEVRVFTWTTTAVHLGLRRLLRYMGRFAYVGEAASGEQALEMLPEVQPDLVIADISMKGMSGVELTRQIKQSHPEVRVLTVSMHDSPYYVREAFAAGADDYVARRNIEEAMREAAGAVLRGKRYLCKDARKLTGEF